MSSLSAYAILSRNAVPPAQCSVRMFNLYSAYICNGDYKNPYEEPVYQSLLC